MSDNINERTYEVWKYKNPYIELDKEMAELKKSMKLMDDHEKEYREALKIKQELNRKKIEKVNIQIQNYNDRFEVFFKSLSKQEITAILKHKTYREFTDIIDKARIYEIYIKELNSDRGTLTTNSVKDILCYSVELIPYLNDKIALCDKLNEFIDDEIDGLKAIINKEDGSYFELVKFYADKYKLDDTLLKVMLDTQEYVSSKENNTKINNQCKCGGCEESKSKIITFLNVLSKQDIEDILEHISYNEFTDILDKVNTYEKYIKDIDENEGHLKARYVEDVAKFHAELVPYLHDDKKLYNKLNQLINIEIDKLKKLINKDSSEELTGAKGLLDVLPINESFSDVEKEETHMKIYKVTKTEEVIPFELSRDLYPDFVYRSKINNTKTTTTNFFTTKEKADDLCQEWTNELEAKSTNIIGKENITYYIKDIWNKNEYPYQTISYVTIKEIQVIE